MLEVDGHRILTDPWLVTACPPFMGAWYHWPPLPDDIIAQVGDCDVIWISHCHEDHYHLPTLRAYMRRWGNKPICTRTMQKQAVADGFELGVIENAVIYVAENCIDSALAVLDSEGNSIVNLTDVHYEQGMIDKILNWCGGPPTIALIPFAGAGPWPQTYYSDPEILAAKAKEKQAMFVERFVQFRDALQPKIAIPFAGQYALGGRLAHLNKWRGMNDAVEMPEPREVLYSGGSVAWVDGVKHVVGRRLEALPATNEDYEFDSDAFPSNREIRELLDRAWDRCQPASAGLHISWNEAGWAQTNESDAYRLSIVIDPRLLKRLLTGQTHWADADAGSHYQMRRTPDVYDKAVMDWLWNFHV